MKNIFIKVAAGVAFLIGLMAAITGTRVLTGSFDPGYSVLTWLVIYNVSMGIVSILAGVLIWKEKANAQVLSGIITIGHISVLISLLTIFSSVAATSSIKAMIFRSVIWIVIFLVVRKFSSVAE